MAVWGTLMALRNSKDAVAFFNCGTRSGASQPHKHMQVIPLETPAPIAQLVRECSKGGSGKKKNRPGNDCNIYLSASCHAMGAPRNNLLILASFPTGDIFSVPFKCINHVILLPNESNTDKSQEDILTEAYITLVDAMLMSLREYSEQENIPEEERLLPTISMSTTLAYNWLLTTEFMMIIPRKREHSDSVNGISLNINSLGFAGMVLAKTSDELQVVKDKGVIALVSETGYSTGWENRTLEQEQKRKEELIALEKQMENALSSL
jgi:ATP adenylyltransferase